MVSYLEFEKPVAELETRLAELRSAAEGDEVDITNELQRLELKSADLLASTYASLTPWQKTQVARHPSRPHFRDYVEYAFEEFVPLGGDRAYGEDEAIMGGFAKLDGRKVVLIGHEKGNDTASRIRHNQPQIRVGWSRKRGSIANFHPTGVAAASVHQSSCHQEKNL